MLLPTIAILLMSLLLGLHASVRVAGRLKNFYVGGNIIPFWVLAVSLSGQAIDIGNTQDNANFVIGSGFWGGFILPAGIGVSLIMIGLFFAEPLHRMRLLTLPDFFYRRYDKRVELIVSITCVTSFILLLAANLAGVGILLEYILGIPQLVGVLLVAAVVTVYAIAGGLFAVTWNDVLHFGVVVFGFVSALVWVFATHDGAVLSAAWDSKFSWEPLYSMQEGSLANWAAFLALALGDIVALDFMERVFAAKSPRMAKVSCLASGVVTIIAGLGASLLAVLGAGIYSAAAGADNQFLHFVTEYLPKGIGTMVLMGLIGACISTADGAIMACSTVVTRNILERHYSRLFDKVDALKVCRASFVPVALIAVVIAALFQSPGALLVLAFDVVFATCLAPLTLGLYWKKANTQAALWSIGAGLSLRIGLAFIIPEEWAGADTLLPAFASWVVFALVALQTKPVSRPSLQPRPSWEAPADV